MKKYRNVLRHVLLWKNCSLKSALLVVKTFLYIDEAKARETFLELNESELKTIGKKIGVVIKLRRIQEKVQCLIDIDELCAQLVVIVVLWLRHVCTCTLLI